MNNGGDRGGAPELGSTDTGRDAQRRWPMGAVLIIAAFISGVGILLSLSNVRALLLSQSGLTTVGVVLILSAVLGLVIRYLDATTSAPLAPPSEGPVVQRCVNQIKFYQMGHAAAQRAFHSVSVIALITGGMVPVLAALPLPDPWDKLLMAIVGFVSTLCMGLLTHFGWDRTWTRHAMTGTVLQGELNLFQAKAPPYSDEKAREAAFAAKIEEIIRLEVGEWRTQVVKQPKAPLPHQESNLTDKPGAVVSQ